MDDLRALARKPRPAGGEAAAEAREYCAAQLRDAGLTVEEQPFGFSALPGRFGAPIIGGISALSLVDVARRGMAGHHWSALRAMAWTMAMAVVLIADLNGRRATRGRFLRRSGVNLEARRGLDPGVWLVAHIDSKSQPVSTAVRTTGAILLIVAALIATVSCVVGFWRDVPTAWWLVGTLSVAGGLPLLLSTVGASSDGAADNASGVATVLEAVRLVKPGCEFGVLITDGEELALAGAREWVLDKPARTAINCDTIDDDGQFVVMSYDAPDLVEVAVDAARAEDASARLIRPLPGVLTDSVAFMDAGWKTVTLSRGTLRTLNRIHTRRDSLQSMQGTAIPAAARILARLVEELA